MIQKITIEKFFELGQQCIMLDVRSPSEYNHAHLPGAYSLPLFDDEERKVVGTLYKQHGKQAAVKQGLTFFGPKMKNLLEETENIIKNDGHALIQPQTKNTVLIHCWRGGMRSAGVAWLLDLYGFQVYILAGGYKAYRNFVLSQFEKDYNLNLIGGYTGSGKTILLSHLKEKGNRTIDLENLANHRGSAFGDIGKQPSQEMFENLLADELCKLKSLQAVVWIEDESQRIGQLNIPPNFWKIMRSKPVSFLDIPFDQRLEVLLKDYGGHDKENLVNSIMRIQKRLGPLETKTAIGFLSADNHKDCFEILLRYYDKLYNKSLAQRDEGTIVLKSIACASVDPVLNAEKLLYAFS